MTSTKVRTKTIPKRRIMPIVLIVLSVVIIGEILAVLWLLCTVKPYSVYWENKAKQSGEITYLALGDSAAQGIGATSPMRGYVGLIAKQLAQKTGKSVRIVNISETGIKTADFTDRLLPKAKDIKADVVTIEIGANDIKTFDAEKFSKDYDRLLPLLPDGTFISNMPLFNSRRSSTQPAKDASKIIEQKLKNYPKLHFVDLQKQTTDHQSIFGFAPDLFHPNNLSYKNWYQAYWDIMRDQIEPTIK